MQERVAGLAKGIEVHMGLYELAAAEQPEERGQNDQCEQIALPARDHREPPESVPTFPATGVHVSG